MASYFLRPRKSLLVVILLLMSGISGHAATPAPADFKLQYLSCHLILEMHFDQTGGGALGVNNERRPSSRLPPSQLVLI